MQPSLKPELLPTSRRYSRRLVALLNRVMVSTDENNRLTDLAALVIQPVYVASANPKILENMNRNGGVFLGAPPAQFKYSVPIFLSSWRYDPLVDINNDGSPLNVLTWNTEDPRVECGNDVAGHTPSTEPRTLQVALVLTPDGATVDQAKTIAVFGHPHGGYTINATLRAMGYLEFVKSFRAIGDSYGIFKYQKLYYFDTFFDNAEGPGDFQDRRKSDPSLRNHLGVFLRTRGRTHQICEYRVTE